MPTDTLNTFQLPYRPDQQRDSVAVEGAAPGHYERPGFNTQQRMLYEADFNRAIMSEADRNEADNNLNLEREETDSGLIDRMYAEERKEHPNAGYNSEQREVVAHPNVTEKVGFKPEMVKPLIESGGAIPRLQALSVRLVYKRGTKALASQ